MAKDDKSKAKPAKETKAKAEVVEHKYGVADLAKLMGVKEASARVQLRNHNVKKDGKSYGWDTKDEVQAIADKIKPSASAKKAKEDAKGTKKKAA